MINNIMNTAISGMNNATLKFNKAAENIVNAPSIAETQIKNTETNAENNTVTTSIINSPTSIIESNEAAPSNGVIANVANMMMAKNAYTASTKLFKTADEMNKAIFDI